MKKAIYKTNRIGNYYDVTVFDHEDFINGNEDIPPYVKPKMKEDYYQPIEVNKVGGYCPHTQERPSSTFVEYRYPEDPYDEVLIFEEKVVINSNNFDCGWISPEGDTYWCEPRCHSETADIISDELYGEYNGERALEEKGWVKIYHESEIDDTCIFAPEGIFYNRGNLPTEKQLSIIKKMGRFTDEFKEFLRMNKIYN